MPRKKNIFSFKDASESILPESWKRTYGATLALLEHAYKQIEEAEGRLAYLEGRITQLEDLASTDPLTELLNRRGYEDFFKQECSRIKRSPDAMGLMLLIDLDHFKSINDTYGHQAGDACLQYVASVLQENLRSTDGIARFGGDEFALFLTHKSSKNIISKVKKIRMVLDRLSIKWQGEVLNFGASIGTSIITKDITFERAYYAADAELYKDKQARHKQDSIGQMPVKSLNFQSQ